MRRPILFSAMIACSLCSAFAAKAADAGQQAQRQHQAVSARVPVRAGGSDMIVDLVAADFFESDLRLAQSRQIEAATAKRYLALDAAGRAQFRDQRRMMWRQMSDQEKAGLRGAKRPRFANLDEAQKQTFRRIASEELGAGAPDGLHPGDI